MDQVAKELLSNITEVFGRCAYTLEPGVVRQLEKAIQKALTEVHKQGFDEGVESTEFYCSNCGACGIVSCCPAPKCKYFSTYVTSGLGTGPTCV